MNYINRSSQDQLINLLDQLGVKKAAVIARSQLKKYLNDPRIDNIIFNLSDTGTHWVGLNKPHKIYFDSYAQTSPIGVPSNYKMASTKKELQTLTAEDCGQLTALFLYYINFKTKAEFYRKFKDVYS